MNSKNLQLESDKFFSFTFTIPPTKKVYHSGRRRRYATMLPKYQHQMLCDLMTKIIWVNHFDFIDYVFEFHTNGTLHIHGYAVVDNNHKNEMPVYRLRDAFYTHNSIIGIAPSVYPRLSDIQETKVDMLYWEKYIAKNQDNIIFKSHYAEQNENIKKIDTGIQPVKIEHRSISPPPDYYDTYRFTGERNKFFVEI